MYVPLFVPQDELNLMKRLKNKYIVKYIDFVRTDKNLYFVLEYVLHWS